jgi:prefoldin subunit 4
MVLDEEEPIKFRIGPSFYEVPFEDAQKRVNEEIACVKGELKAEQARKAQFDGQIQELKKRLYVKFGDEIMLELS